MYTSGEGRPESSSARPWRGVYHHYDSYPSALGQHLLGCAAQTRGDLSAVVKRLVDEAPHGWSTCLDSPPVKYPEDDAGPPVAPDNIGFVDYVYVFDLAARRLDLFARESEKDARRIDSVTFSEAGDAWPRAFVLSEEEKVDEPPLPGQRLEPAALDALLGSLPTVESAGVTLNWLKAEETPTGGLKACFREIIWDSDGAISGVIEQGWPLVPPAARDEPLRVENCLRALAKVLPARPKMISAFGLMMLDPLVRSGARNQATFERLFHSYAPRFERD